MGTKSETYYKLLKMKDELEEVKRELDDIKCTELEMHNENTANAVDAGNDFE